MTPDQVYDLLQVAAAADERVIATPERAAAWSPLLGHLDYGVALEALYGHLRASNQVVRPSDLLYLASAPTTAQDPFAAILEATGHSLTLEEERRVRAMLATGIHAEDIITEIRRAVTS